MSKVMSKVVCVLLPILSFAGCTEPAPSETTTQQGLNGCDDHHWHSCSHAADNCSATCTSGASCGDCQWTPNVGHTGGKWKGPNDQASECPQTGAPIIGEDWIRPYCQAFLSSATDAPTANQGVISDGCEDTDPFCVPPDGGGGPDTSGGGGSGPPSCGLFCDPLGYPASDSYCAVSCGGGTYSWHCGFVSLDTPHSGRCMPG
jgi:hypothetical protein